MKNTWQTRTAAVLGEDGIEILKNSCAVIVGLGGVGSYAFEAIVRAGVGKIVIVDHDTVDVTNINRQLVASISSVGKDKASIAYAHGKDVNADCEIIAVKEFICKDNFEDIIPNNADIIIDAIDSVESKIGLIEYAKLNEIKVLSSMGTANKLDPLKFKFDDISKTSVDPLARVIRRKLKEKGISGVDVVYSTEKPKINEQDRTMLGSLAFVPSVAGLILASKAIEYLIGMGNKRYE